MLTSRLGGFSGLRVADLFAGSGALGFEALSRGAASCVFVEQDRAAIAAIRANAAALLAGNADVRQQSVQTLGKVPAPHDLLFLDPPYGAVELAPVLLRLIDQGWAGPGSMISVETAAGAQIGCDGMTALVSRKVGKAELHLLTVD
jgi:16S rRNA (guanine966-N2)-methyltransferase